MTCRGLVAALGLAVAACGGGGGGVVSAGSPEAAQAGIEILQAGGNALDAAVAVSFALGVTEPAMSGLGGQTQILLHAPGEQPVVINGTSYAPRATRVDATAEEITGYRATTIPTTVKVLDYAWRHYGSGAVEWAELLAPAIRFAGDGFAMGPFRARVRAQSAEALRGHPAARRHFLAADGAPPAEGDTWRQPALAASLRRLAEHGAEDFYTGEIARQIADDMAANDGWLSAEDLAWVPEPAELAPLHVTYRGWDVYSLPPPGAGWVVLQALNLLETSTSEAPAPGSDEHTLWLADALRIAHRNRRDDPVQDLVGYGDAVARRLDPGTARALLEATRGETTHFTVADRGGMVVSVTASLNSAFGARVAHPELGFLYNNYMIEYVLGDTAHPFALRPRAMPYSSMSPTVVARGGRPVLGLGSPGSARIISAVAQVAQRWMDGPRDVSAAVAAPRVHVIPDSIVFLEPPETAEGLRAALEARGFVVAPPRSGHRVGRLHSYFGGVHAVALEDGRWTGAADPRRDGAVVRERVGG